MLTILSVIFSDILKVLSAISSETVKMLSAIPKILKAFLHMALL